MKFLMFLLSFGLSLNASAQVYAGEKKMKAKQSIELKGTVHQIIDGESDYKIAIGIHAAFYSFPKTEEKEEVLNLLKQSQKEGFKVKASVDPLTLKILTLQRDDKK